MALPESVQDLPKTDDANPKAAESMVENAHRTKPGTSLAPVAKGNEVG
jgi:hypothetical protein